jgi:hypothetical protein
MPREVEAVSEHGCDVDIFRNLIETTNRPKRIMPVAYTKWVSMPEAIQFIVGLFGSSDAI